MHGTNHTVFPGTPSLSVYWRKRTEPATVMRNRVRIICTCQPRHAARGQVLIIFAMASFVLIGFVALAVDTGFLMAERRHTQNAVDAGALAGAKSVQRSETAEA